MTTGKRDRDRRGSQPLPAPDEGSAARRILWALVGAAAYAAAKYVFGF